MKIGYGRTSTLEQRAGLEAQVNELKAQGCDKVFTEQISSVGERPQLLAALEYLREGDTLVATKLDRLARSVRHLGEITEKVTEKGASLQIVDLGIDTSNATGELVMNLLGAVAQFERQIMLERQREGIEKARREGKFRGRMPTAQAKSSEVRQLATTGQGATVIAKSLGISRASVYRILKEAEKGNAGAR